MVKIEGLKRMYGRVAALDGLDMHVRDGALYGFVGPNGAGKTTTIKILTGLLVPDEGKVEIGGEDAVKDPGRMVDKIGYVPDFFGVYDNLKVSEYMELFASCYGLTGLTARKRSMELLGQVGLEEKTDYYVDGLSRGMKQRLCLARALIHDPQLLIMDEPTSGLDPRTRYEFKEILKDLRDQEKTVVISSHLLSELSEICTDIGIVEQGKMVLEGTMDHILNQINVQSPLRISVYQGREQALKILRSHPYVETMTIRHNDIMLNFTGDKEDEAALLQQLIDGGVQLCGFMRERGNLESVFMQITSHEEEGKVLIHEN
ncbi:MAG: ABC transporter ATP-binding protein [Hungatella sp.]|jgi:ABC-2 type transport system ATP-binding protein|nr:ABC transporter ATP-binding protein [Hungatella sp.]MCI9634862.1 ABC transporter ATP-binding protein [Hungatella sp.]